MAFNGTNGNDILDGTVGDDTIRGGAGNDLLTGGAGSDIIDGGAGDDEIVLASGSGPDRLLSGGDGIDTINAETDYVLESFSFKNGFERLGNVFSFGFVGGQPRFASGFKGTSADNILDFSSITLSAREDTFGIYVDSDLGTDLVVGTSFDDYLMAGAGNDGISGSDGDDELFGEDGEDTLSGGVGNDLLGGGNGRDTLTGGAGNDLLDGGADNDILRGGAGNDLIISDAGADRIDGGDGNDRVLINGGSPTPGSVLGGAGEDAITTDKWTLNRFSAANGFERLGADKAVSFTFELRSMAIASTFRGTGGADQLDFSSLVRSDWEDGRGILVQGGEGADLIRGSSFDDWLFGDNGDDRLLGGDGNDRLYGGGGGGADVLSGGRGDDRIFINGTIDGGAVITARGGAGTDEFNCNFGVFTAFSSLNGFEKLGSGINIVKGTAEANVLDFSSLILNAKTNGEGIDVRADGGNDRVMGTAFDDFLQGEAGDDFLAGGNGNDSLVEYAGNNTLRGGQGDDRINATGGANIVSGGSGNDEVYVNGSGGIVHGDAGNDVLDVWTDLTRPEGGPIKVYGDAGDDTISINNHVTAFGGAGFDTISFNAYLAHFSAANGFEKLGLGDGPRPPLGDDGLPVPANTVRGTEAGNVLDFSSLKQTADPDLGVVVYGNGGADTITGTSFIDVLFGDADDDRVFGGAGDDRLTGSSGDDVVNGGTGNDDVSGDVGNDRLIGGLGNDTLRGDAGFVRGADTFVFGETLNGLSNVDTITDFRSGDGDRIELSRAVFAGLAAGSTLGASAFVQGSGLTAAGDADDRLVYDTATGKLYYDADGVGGQTAILFAILSGDPGLAATDFLIAA